MSNKIEWAYDIERTNRRCKLTSNIDSTSIVLVNASPIPGHCIFSLRRKMSLVVTMGGPATPFPFFPFFPFFPPFLPLFFGGMVVV